MGRFSVEIEVANNDDLALVRRGALPKAQVRRRRILAVVDSGATKLVLPASLVKDLGLPRGDKIRVRYADGRTAQRRGAEAAYVELLGRHGTFTAVVEPKRKTALLGAIVLEDLDLLVDCPNERVVPRDPHGIVHEIE
jgi:predicted aspartyl protease